MTKPLIGPELKIFDPRDRSTGSGGAEVLDPTVVRRGDRWCMYLAGQAEGFGATEIYSASLPPSAPLSANGWTLTRDSAGQLASLAAHGASRTWDGNGGRHCPAYVKGWDPHRRTWVERIYYAGAVDNLWGPYSIGFLEWDGERWVDQPHPVFVATEDWERGSVYEPNLLYHAGKWRMWYVAGANQDDYLVHGYAESDDGVGGWSEHVIFAPADMRMFDFCVRHRRGGFDAIFARVWVGAGTPPPETGLWWCSADTPSATLSGWSDPIQIMTAESRGWHSGPWKPSLALDDGDDGRGFVFFDGLYRTNDPGPFPFAFTLGCVPIRLP